jgi:VCBS repeat-containing protein
MPPRYIVSSPLQDDGLSTEKEAGNWVYVRLSGAGMFNLFKKLRRKPAEAPPVSQSAAPSTIKQSLLSLEQRLMFDAAAAATAAEVHSEQVAQDQAEAAVSSEGTVESTTHEQQESQELLHAMASYTPGESATEVVFVDPTVPDYESLLAGMGPNVEVVVLDASRDGVEQIAASLSGRSGIDAIHLISHGDAGTLQLGTGTLNAESMSTRYADELTTIQQTLSEQADILVYGCNFAEGDVGQAAVARLAELTGADVAANSDRTGHIDLGGDWKFETQVGSIETDLAITDAAQMDWKGILTTETVGDQFSSSSYDNHDGTQKWASDWSETDAGGGGASGGDVHVAASQLRIDAGSVGNQASRQVDLSGTSGAILTFDYTNSLSGSDQIEIRVSADGTTYTTLTDGVFSPKSNAGSGTVKLDISGYASASTTIQFIVTGVGGGDPLYVDNVQVSYDTGAANSAPTISSNGGGTTASITVGENSTVVTTVTATDVDAGHTLGYSIAGGADAARFTISNSTGQLSFVSAPSYEAPADSGGNNVYDVTVQVSDGQGGTDTQAIAVTVTNVNEAPTDLALSANTVAENAANGTVVGTVSGSDVDTGDTKTYSLTDNAGGRFAINSSTGQLTVANASLLNYESATSHTVTARVTDSGGLTYDETFTINVTDVNEAAPRITSNGGGATALINIAENSTAVTRVTASDADTRQTLGYSIVGGADAAKFTINSSTGALSFVSAPNYEAPTDSGGNNIYDVTVQVSDGNGGVDSQAISVTVTAVNERPTDLSLSANTIAEHAANGTVVGTVSGTDPDAGDTKSYSLTNTAGGRFAINRTTGALTVANSTLLNYEAATSHAVTVRVTDRGGLTYDETFTINLTNVHEAPSGTNATVTINEDTSHILTAANFGFSDVDAGDALSAVRIDTLPTAGTLTLSGVAVTAGQVITTADLAAGQLVFTPAANANGTGYARVTFSVRDSTSLYDPTPNQLTVNVTAVNDRPTDLSLSANTIAEHAANGTVVGTVSGTDPDAGDTKSYSLTNTAGGRFAINRTTGALTVANSTLLNYEAATSHAVTVRVTDRGGLTYDETFTINLTNVNEAPSGTNATVTITEDTSHILTAANFGFSDVDAGDALSAVRIDTLPTAGTLTLSGVAVTAGQVITTADLAAGQLVFTPAANANGTGYARVTFSVRDSTSLYDPTPNQLTVNVTAVNDRPTDLSLSANTIAEHAANGTVVGTVSGTDPDAGDTKSYSLTNTAGGRFAINRTTGALTVANSTLLNYEAATSHAVTVRVTDRGGLTYDETFTINLTNVNEAPSGTNATVTITEDTSHILTAANFGFSDVDAGDALSAVRIDTLPTAGTLTLSGVAVTAGQVITTADLAAGQLVFTPAANANGTGYARVTFSVRDSTSLYDPTPNQLTVNVTAVNDRPTDLSLSANTIAEHAANGTVVGTVSGTDPDAGDTKSYSLTNTAGGRFAINRTTGALTVANSTLLNYEAATSHAVTVRVTDRGGLTYDETFTINLTNVNEAPSGTNATVTITEDTSHILTAANFGFSDVDAGDALSAVRIDTLPTAGTLTLSGVAVTAGQVITTADLAAGQLVFTPAANANGTGYARVTFSVRDSTSLYDPTPNQLTVNVTAVNDRPVITANSGSSVAEGGLDTITSAELAVVDVDNSAAQLRFSVGTGPAHGRLELTTRPGVALATFTQADLAANRLVYRHDGSETLSDRFTFTVSDGAGGSVGTTTMTLTITPVNDAPTIVSDGGTAAASITVAEHVTGITVVTGADVDVPVQALTYSISGGADQAQFTIDATTGALSFVAPPDFEAAADANGDNVYVVQVRVTDSQGGTAMQTIQVRVTDGAEAISPLLPPSLIPMPSVQAGTSVQPHDEPLPFAVRQEPVNAAVSMNGTDLAGTMSRYTDSMPPRVAPPSGDVRHGEGQPAASRSVQSDHRGPWNSSPISPTDAIEAGRDGNSGSQPSATELVLNKLDEVILSLREAVTVDREPQSLMAQVTALTGTTLSVGFVLWAVRKGKLLAGCCATIPTLSAEEPGRRQRLRPRL